MDGTGAFIYFNVRPSSILYCRLLCILITVIASSRFWWSVFDWSNFSKIQAQNNSICCAKPLTPALLVAPCQVWQSQTAPQYRTQLKYLLEPVLPKTSSCSVLVNKQRYNKWEHHEKLLPLTFGFASYATYFSGPSFSDLNSFHDVFQHHQRWQTILPNSLLSCKIIWANK